MGSNNGKLTVLNYLLNTVTPNTYRNFNLYENEKGRYTLTFEVLKSKYDVITESVDIKIKNDIRTILERIDDEWIKFDKPVSNISYVIENDINSLNESENRETTVVNEKRIEKWLNKKMPETFDWWIKTEVESSEMMNSNVFVLKQNLEVDSEWLHQQWIYTNDDKPFPDIEYGEEINLSDVIGRELASKLRENVRQIVGHIIGVLPKYVRLVTFVTPVDREDIPDQILDEQYTPTKTSVLKNYKQIKFTGNTQPLGLSKIETPQSFMDKINKNFSVPVFRLNSEGYDFPVYRLEGKYEHNGKKYIIDLRPETGNNFALIGTIKIAI